MMLSNRITAKSLELKPASQARNRMVKDRRDCQPAGCVSPPDRPPPPPPHPAAALGRPLPETEPPAPGLALCLHSEVCCSAMFWSRSVRKAFPRPHAPLRLALSSARFGVFLFAAGPFSCADTECFC